MKLIERTGDETEIEMVLAIVDEVAEKFEEVCEDREVDPRGEKGDSTAVLLSFVLAALVDDVRGNVLNAEDDGPIRDRTWSKAEAEGLVDLLGQAKNRIAVLVEKLGKTRAELGVDDDFDMAEGQGRR